MAGYRRTQITPPSDDTDFEIACVVLFKGLLNDPNVTRLGTSGQGQDGVDLVGHRNGDPDNVVGVQCKVKSGRSKLTKKEVLKETNAALGFQSPALLLLYGQLWIASILPKEQKGVLFGGLARLGKSVGPIAAQFPGPFDDFGSGEVLTSENEVFREIEEKLDEASKLSDVPGLTALTNIARPSERLKSNVLRILERPIDEPVADDGRELPYLRLCAHIAGVARSEPIADAVIKRCLFMARSKNPETETDILLLMVQACAANRESKKFREVLGETASKLCFAIDEPEKLGTLDLIFDTLETRDTRLIPHLARARAIARTKIG